VQDAKHQRKHIGILERSLQIAGIGDLEPIQNYRDLYDPARVSAVKRNKKQLAQKEQEAAAQNEIATMTTQLDVVKDTLNLNETKVVKSYNQLQNIEDKKTPALVHPPTVYVCDPQFVVQHCARRTCTHRMRYRPRKRSNLASFSPYSHT
jgi:hypothetical protein